MRNKNLVYPLVPNIDDTIESKEDVLFDVFMFGETYRHFELLKGQTDFEVKDGRLYQEGQLNPAAKVIPHENLNIVMAALPRKKLMIGGLETDTLRIHQDLRILLTRRDDSFSLLVYNITEPVYVNGRQI